MRFGSDTRIRRKERISKMHRTWLSQYVIGRAHTSSSVLTLRLKKLPSHLPALGHKASVGTAKAVARWWFLASLWERELAPLYLIRKLRPPLLGGECVSNLRLGSSTHSARGPGWLSDQVIGQPAARETTAVGGAGGWTLGLNHQPTPGEPRAQEMSSKGTLPTHTHHCVHDLTGRRLGTELLGRWVTARSWKGFRQPS